MSTPYVSPTVTALGGTVALFPLSKLTCDDPDLASAVDALFYADETRWPEEGGSNVPLKTWLVDCPDANAAANWLAHEIHDSWLPGVVAAAPDTDASGSVPYVNPQNSSNPDLILALNYVIDNRG